MSTSTSSGSDSEANTTSFFCRPTELAHSKQRRVERERPNRDSSPHHSSSDLEFVDNPMNASRRNEPHKGKAKAKAKGKYKEPLAKRNKRHAATAVEVLTESDASDLEPLDKVLGPVSSTQIERSGDAMRELVRERGGLVVAKTPPARAAAKNHRSTDGSDAAGDLGWNQNRKTSNSTAPTSLSSDDDGEQCSHGLVTASATKKRPRRAGNTTATAKDAENPTTRKRRPRGPAADDVPRSPSPQLEPVQPRIPPKSFWGAEALPLRDGGGSGSRVGGSTAKAKVGEKSAKLRTLSEQRRILDLGDHHHSRGGGGGGLDDTIRGSSASDTDGEEGRDGSGARYESVANKEKRQRLEGLAKLKARRNGTGNYGTGPFRAMTNTATARSTATTSCPVCSDSVPKDLLNSHLDECAPQLDVNADDLGFTQVAPPPRRCPPPPPPPSAPVAGPSNATNAFRASRPVANRGGGGGRGHAARTGQVDNNSLAHELFPSQEDGPEPGDGDDGRTDEDDVPIPVPGAKRRVSEGPHARARASATRVDRKGKGKATVASVVRVEDSDDEVVEEEAQADDDDDDGDDDEYGYADDGDGFIDEDELDEIERHFAERGGGGHGGGGRGGASLHKTVINIDEEDEEDDDDLIIEESGPSRTQQARAAAGGGPGFIGRVNSKRLPGPPQDGSPPPKGSIFLSTMSRAFKEGYERMYARASGHKDVEAAEAADFDPMRVQKMTTANAVGGRGGRGGRRGRGGFRARGGRGRKRS